MKEELVRVIVEVAEVPACTAAGEVAEMVKSPTCNVTLNEWVILPRELTPVIVARYVPGVEELREQLVVTVLFDVSPTGEDGHVIDRPLAGMNVDESLTESSKLLLVRLTGMTAPEAPKLKLIEGFVVEIT